MKKTYRSRVLRSVHLMMEDAHHVGAIDNKTMQRFDQSCLVPVATVAPDQIRAIRDREEVSQTVFARLVLGLLLSSEAAGDNLGLFRPSLGAGVPAAQKQGWISSARHSAAVVYTSRGPVVVVALTYQPRLTRSSAARLGTALITIAVGQ